MILTLSQMDSSINNTLQKSKYTIPGITTSLYSENHVPGYFREFVLYAKLFVKCQKFKLKDYE
jgi:hypothetical protein